MAENRHDRGHQRQFSSVVGQELWCPVPLWTTWKLQSWGLWCRWSKQHHKPC